MPSMTVITVIPPAPDVFSGVARVLECVLDPAIQDAAYARLRRGVSVSLLIPTATLWDVTGLLVGAGATTISKPVPSC